MRQIQTRRLRCVLDFGLPRSALPHPEGKNSTSLVAYVLRLDAQTIGITTGENPLCVVVWLRRYNLVMRRRPKVWSGVTSDRVRERLRRTVTLGRSETKIRKLKPTT